MVVISFGSCVVFSIFSFFVMCWFIVYRLLCSILIYPVLHIRFLGVYLSCCHKVYLLTNLITYKGTPRDQPTKLRPSLSHFRVLHVQRWADD